MKKSVVFSFVLCFSFVTASNAQTDIDLKKSLRLVFDGRTPCRELAIQLKKPAGPQCIKIKWRLILNKVQATDISGNLTMEGYGFRGENALKGTWKETKGKPGDPNAKLIELNLGEHGKLQLLNLDDIVLFFLDDKKNLLVGNKDFSYALYLNKEKSAP